MAGGKYITSREELRERIREALLELPLAPEDIERPISRLTRNTGSFSKPFREDSAYFDFRGKVMAVVEHFDGAVLTLPVYLKAAVRQPSLFGQSSETIQGNIEAVVAHFSEAGLTLPMYLGAAVKQPSLFCQAPETIRGNIEAVVAHFGEAGMTLSMYLQAAVRHPPLFCQSPEKIQGNIEGVVAHFCEAGLTLPTYLKAAVRQPSLFGQSSETIQGNIEGVVAHFGKAGLTRLMYLQAAVKQPQLFYRSPATIIGHMNQLISLYERGLVAMPTESPGKNKGLRPLFDFLLKNPRLLGFAESNLGLRTAYAAMQRPKSLRALSASRKPLEAELAERLGHPDLQEPVGKVDEASSGRGDFARNLVLRAFIRNEFIKGGSLRER